MDVPTPSREQPMVMELSMKGSIQPALLCWSLISDSDAGTAATVAGTLPCLSQDVDGSELYAFLTFLRSVRYLTPLAVRVRIVSHGRLRWRRLVLTWCWYVTHW